MTLAFEGREDLFRSPAEVIVIPVNTVGAMGAGLALAYKNLCPNGFEAYRDYCRSGMLVPGTPVMHSDHCERAAMFFPTKKHWSDPSKLEWVGEGLDYILWNERDFGFSSIAFPALGCGLGQLPYSTAVRPLLRSYLEAFESVCYICL